MSPIVVRSQQGYQTPISIRHHVIIADELVQDGGSDTGPTPMEMLLGSVGGFIAVTTRAYAQCKHWPLESVCVELEMERVRREDSPAYTGHAPFVHEIRERIPFDGPLTDPQKARLLAISRKCPIHLTLENPVFFVEHLREDAENGSHG